MDQPTPRVPTSRTAVFIKRTASTLVLWSLVTGIFLSRYSWAFLALIGVLVVLATMEYFRMLKAANVPCFRSFGVIISIIYCLGLYAYFLNGEPEVSFALDSLMVFITTAGAFALQMRYPIRGSDALMAVAMNVMGFVYIAFLFNFTARVTFMLPVEDGSKGLVNIHGAYLLLWLLAVTKFTDMGAYMTGSLIGKHKMIPHISPGKTWEGFFGALVFAQIAACGLYFLFPHQLYFFGHVKHVILLGFLLAVLAVVGDLAESVVKRALAAKDSGSILPGIGGSLDLIDSICFTAPALYFYLKWIVLPNA